MTTPFVHLHTHSQYSLLDSSLPIPELVAKAKALGMPAVALTDHGNLYGAIDFYKQCKDAKMKAIIGCEMYLAPTSRLEKKKTSNIPVAFHLTLLAKNLVGYHNLCKLSSIGYLEGFYYYPRIDFEALQKYSEGLICLSGCLQSQISYEILQGKNIQQTIDQYKALFGEDFYLELQRHTMTAEDIQLDGVMDESWYHLQYQDYTAKQERVNQHLIEIAKDNGILLVATNNVHFLEREDWKAHEILINIQSGEPCEIWQEDSNGNKQFRTPNPKRQTFPSHELYFKSQEEMQLLFRDIPEAITNTSLVAEKCDLKLDFSIKHYPVYLPPTLPEKYTEEERKQSVNAYLLELCEKAIPKRYPKDKLEKVAEKYPGQDPEEVVRKRLEYEMSIICSKDMCDYLLIVWDFIYWAKNQGIPMGPGRGSGAGSIICYLSGITDIEPLRFSLFFERFINPERLSYPDIDVDICMDRRPDVINYTIQKYGKDNVAQIITFGTMKAKMVIRDVGRTLSIPLTKVNAIVKLIPEDLNITIDKALEKDVELNQLYKSDPDAKKIIDIGKKLEGCMRSTGIHAAGLIVSGQPLADHIPICLAKDSNMLATQYSMKPVETVGMLKIDFLGLKTLTCIQICQNAVKARGIDLDWTNLSLEDPKTFELLNQGKTQGIFQLESGGMQELSKNLHLDKFEEIIAVVALYRPGPMDMIPSFIARKHGREAIENDHPWMKEILSETYGIMVYQEQVMQIASKLANYSLGEGDVLRRAMGKKDMKEMAKQREKFIAGCVKNEISDQIAGIIFDKMEKFAEYGFNKSHAAAYGYLSYVTAYLKAHYPGEWLAALMSCDRDDTTKIAKFTHEGKQIGIPILSPDCNESQLDFVSTGAGIRFAMSGIKGVGTAVVEAIIEERTRKGPYTSLYSFIKRVDLKRIGKKAVELLIDAGAFDFTKWHRDAMKASLDAMYDQALRSQKDAASGVLSLFQNLEDNQNLFSKPPKLAKLSTKEEQLFREKELLGFFLSGHPLDQYKELVKHLGCLPLSYAEEALDGVVFRTAFVIDVVSPRTSSKTQKKFVILTVSDPTGTSFELPIWPELYEEKQTTLIENSLIFAVLAKEKRGEESQLSCKWLYDLKLTDEEVAHGADAAYDKAKFQIARQLKHPPKPKDPKKEAEKQKEREEEKKGPEKLAVHIDLNALKASHILLLQSILKQQKGKGKGSHLVEIRFLIGEQEVSTLLVDSKWSVIPCPSLEEEFKEVPSVIAINY
ncbi:MAG: dnaE [Chlamydiia bacterium]|nr:dnaE [Chlamydiia bacterium]